MFLKRCRHTCECQLNLQATHRKMRWKLDTIENSCSPPLLFLTKAHLPCDTLRSLWQRILRKGQDIRVKGYKELCKDWGMNTLDQDLPIIADMLEEIPEQHGTRGLSLQTISHVFRAHTWQGVSLRQALRQPFVACRALKTICNNLVVSALVLHFDTL